MKTMFKKFASDESGATAIEYGLIAGLVSVGLITVLGTLGTDLKATFTKISAAVTTAKAP